MKRISQIEPWVGEEEKRELIAVVDSGWITEAKRTAKFEKMVADFVGAKYALAVNNGTVSLTIGLMALGVGPGDEVIVPDFTMVASANAVRLAGAVPVLADVRRENLCIDPNEIRKKITSRTKVIMPVSLNGRSPEMREIKQMAKKHGLSILEDAAQALGCYFEDQHLGTIGEIGSFSFSTPKVITTGQGGVLVTDNKRLRNKMYRLKDFGRPDRKIEDYNQIGFNFKFTDFQAAVGIAQMGKLKWRLRRKKDMYRLYRRELENISGIEFLKTDLAKVSPWLIDVFVEDPRALKAYLNSKGIGTRSFYPALHTLKLYRSRERFPNSLWASKRGLWLPSSTFLKDGDIRRVCREIKKFFEGNK